MEVMLSFIVGVACGWFLFRHLLYKKVEEMHNHMMDEYHQAYQTKKEKENISVTFEKRNGNIYVYNRENDHFITQGKTYKDVVDNLSDRFPEITFTATPGALKKIKDDSLSV